MFARDIEKSFNERKQYYPIITVIGPRQSGKTTLVKKLCPDFAYINLEQPNIREIAELDPQALFSKYPSRLIIDEVQRVPSLLSYLQVKADELNKEGLFILTGSHQHELQQALTQSLAGRTALLKLLPLSLHELSNADLKHSTDLRLLNGGYPKIHLKKVPPSMYYSDYVKTYLERDVKQMINLKDFITFQRFIRLVAARTGTVLNLSSLGAEIGVSHNTIKHWLSILQASYLIEFIPPFYENFGKQLIKSPKLYFTDVGLACHLLNIETLEQVERDPLRGQLFETLVVMEFIKKRLNAGKEHNLYFYRDNNQREIDLIYKQGSNLIPIEIKSSQTFHSSFTKNLTFLKKLLGERVTKSYLVYAGKESFDIQGHTLMNYQDIFELEL